MWKSKTIKTYIPAIHSTPASSLCRQPPRFKPSKRHWVSLCSVPLHVTSLITMGPVPWPNLAPVCASASTIMCVINDVESVLHAHPHILYYIPEPEYPRCLHATAASALLHSLLHTVPHTPSMHTSTRPCRGLLMLINLISPSLQSVGERWYMC